MTRNRIIFYLVFGVFHLAAFIFTVVLSNNAKNIDMLLQLASWIPMFKWGTLFGLSLLIADVIWDYSVQKNHQKTRDALTHELNMLKAKLFDIQESAKNQTPGEPKA